MLDITREVTGMLAESGVRDGQLAVYTPHATAAITVNENDDPNIGTDFLRALAKMVPEHDGWLHDRIDDNAHSHIKAALLGPSELLPVVAGDLALGTWQRVLLVELDGPRRRRVIVTLLRSA